MTDDDIMEFVATTTKRAAAVASELGLGAGFVSDGNRSVSTEMAWGSVVQTFVDAAVRLKMCLLQQDQTRQLGGSGFAVGHRVE
jgi:hypothetical protein